MPKAWTEQEIAFAKDEWKSLGPGAIAKQLGKSLYAVTHYGYRQGWSRHAPANVFDQLTPEEKAYIAGIIDGEGHIEIRLGGTTVTGRKPYSISIIVANTDYGLLDWLQRRLPGSYIREKIYRAGKAHWKPAWTLRLHRRGSVRALLMQVLPYMVVKRVRAMEAIHAIDTIKKSYWR